MKMADNSKDVSLDRIPWDPTRSIVQFSQFSRSQIFAPKIGEKMNELSRSGKKEPKCCEWSSLGTLDLKGEHEHVS